MSQQQHQRTDFLFQCSHRCRISLFGTKARGVAARFALFRTRLNDPHLSLPLLAASPPYTSKTVAEAQRDLICEDHSFAADRHSAFLLCCASPINRLSLSATNLEPRQTAALCCLQSASYFVLPGVSDKLPDHCNACDILHLLLPLL